jgi:hypothetical protein
MDGFWRVMSPARATRLPHARVYRTSNGAGVLRTSKHMHQESMHRVYRTVMVLACCAPARSMVAWYLTRR